MRQRQVQQGRTIFMLALIATFMLLILAAIVGQMNTLENYNGYMLSCVLITVQMAI